MKNQIYVWDYMVRFFHWTLVLAFTIAYLTGEELDLVHAYAGYYIMGLIALRIIWGIIGSKYARFSQFIYSPRSAMKYLRGLFSSQAEQKNEKQYIGHNPAGGWMVIALLVSILATGYSGLKVYGLEGNGPLAVTTAAYSQTQQPGFIKVSDDDDSKNPDVEFWEEIHEFLANFTVLLIFLHVAGVILSSRKHHQNLVKSMITGYKESE